MSLTGKQVEALLRPINPRRVLQDNKGMSHVSQQDIRAHLTRVFGFGGWSSEVLDLTLVREAPGVGRDGKDKGWAVTYRCTLRLSVRDPEGHPVASFEDAATGTSPNLPTLGDAHDFACKVAVSMALKRAATNLGDGFGLSLYNKGQTAALVIGTLVVPGGPGEVVDDVPEQVSMGHDDAGSSETPERPAERGPTPPDEDPWANGGQGVKRPPETDPAWVADWSLRVAGCAAMSELRGLFDELSGQVKVGKVITPDAVDLRALIEERSADLSQTARVTA